MKQEEVINIVMSINECVILNNGVKMPWLGLGVFGSGEGQETINAVRYAFESGYRGVDTASLYGNEKSVGMAVRQSSIPREEIFVTTKVWNTDQGYDSTLKAFDKSKKTLGLDYVDLYLIHWPVKNHYIDTWRALEKLYNEGLVRAIGVSNFNKHHLQDIFTESDIIPAVNQVEFHPNFVQNELFSFCDSNGIRLEAWSPLARGRVFEHQTILSLCAKYGKTPAQIVLRWELQKGIVVIPKSSNKDRIIENSKIFDFELDITEIGHIDNMHTGIRIGADPDNFDF